MSDELVPITLQERTVTLLNLNIDRAIKYDSILEKIENFIFSDEVINIYINNKEIDSLLKIFAKIYYYKSQSEGFILRILELANKNDIMKKYINAMVSSNHNLSEEVPEITKMKVDKALKHLSMKGLNLTHGKKD